VPGPDRTGQLTAAERTAVSRDVRPADRSAISRCCRPSRRP